MRRFFVILGMLALVAGISVLVYLYRAYLPGRIAEPLGLRADISDIRAKQAPLLTRALARQGLTFGAPVFLRIFKEESVLELWVENDGTFSLFKTYAICHFSGDLGPKLREGDRQSPEGIYHVTKSALNPNSSFHLSFNLGFPNTYDQSLGRTGSFLMVHGNCVSIGCYAMTDPLIEEIYVLVEAALEHGQDRVPVHAFPFRLSETRLKEAAQSPWHGFWQDLKPIYQAFEATKKVPFVSVKDQKYHLN